jgi:hypothetical protein
MNFEEDRNSTHDVSEIKNEVSKFDYEFLNPEEVVKEIKKIIQEVCEVTKVNRI